MSRLSELREERDRIHSLYLRLKAELEGVPTPSGAEVAVGTADMIGEDEEQLRESLRYWQDRLDRLRGVTSR